MTFNIHAWRDASHQDNLERLIALVNAVQPDVLCLNEALHPFVAPPPDHPYWAEVRARRGHGLEPPRGSKPADDREESYLRRLSKATGLPHCAFACANEEGSFFGAIPFGNAILSRHPLRDVRRHVMGVTRADLTLGGQARTEADLEPRAALAAVVELPGGAVGVCSTHLDHKAEELRERQIDEAIAFAASSFGGRAHFLCGDLNTFQRVDLAPEQWEAVAQHYNAMGWPPPNEESSVLRRLTQLGYTDTLNLCQQHADESIPASPPHPPLTCWSHKPLFRLDYVFFSPGGQEVPSSDVATGDAENLGPSQLEILSHRTLESTVSDHYPVVVDVVLHDVANAT